MRIILNADDFGRDDDTVDATIDCFERGLLTGATIMPAMPATARAVEFALAHPEFSFGVHLTFVRETEHALERPICDPAAVADLADADGRFLHSDVIRKKAMLGKIDVAQIQREAEAQIKRLRECGLTLSHVDSHGHLHKFRPFRRALVDVLQRCGIDKVRSAQDVYLSRVFHSPTYWFGGYWRRKLRRLFRTTDHLYMPASTDGDWVPRLLNLAGSDNSLEIGVHPGGLEPWRRTETERLARFVPAARNGHVFIGWKDL